VPEAMVVFIIVDFVVVVMDDGVAVVFIRFVTGANM
jgi:hypothetical protein